MKKITLLFLSFFLFPFSCIYSQYMIYGVTLEGGSYYNQNNQIGYGTIFSYNPITHKQTVVFNFNDTDGTNPIGGLLYASDSLLYGITGRGGTHNMGTVFSFNPKTRVESVIINFDSTNGYAGAGANELIQGKDGLLYGTSWGGGKYGNGVLFSYDTHTHKDSIRCNFNDSTSEGIYGGPYMELWQDTATGILYGVTERGGHPGGGGVIYGFNPATNILTRYVLATSNGTNPWGFTGGLTLAKNGLLYGMSQWGGLQDSGTIYSFNITSHTIQTVQQLSGMGTFPNGNELLQLSNTLLYGGIRNIGRNGVLFSFNYTNNKEKILKTFHDTDGSEPYGRLIQDPDNGLLYGITALGGYAKYGVLFSYDTSNSTYVKLLDFTGLNGIVPVAGLTLVKDTSVHVIKDSGTNTAVNNIKYESGLAKVYPNPANTLLNVEINLSDDQIAYFTMYNSIGEKIENMELNNEMTTLSINNLPAGMYYYRITDKDGSVVKADKQLIIH